MRTTDTTYKTNYGQNGSYQYDEIEFDVENYESLSQKETSSTDNIDNFILSQIFGQNSLEKAILLLTLIILFSVAILYYYWNFFKLYLIKLLLISSSVDLVLLLFFCALRLKFNSNDWINSFPNQFYNFLDFIIIINFLLKFIIFILYFFIK